MNLLSIKIILLCILSCCTLSLFSQIKFEKLIWFNNLPTSVANQNAHSYVNAIEYNKQYYVFGLNTGKIPDFACSDIYDGWNIFKLDSSGNLLRALRIGGPLRGERVNAPVIQTKDKGFLIPGYSISFSVQSKCDSFDCNFIKLDSNLNIEWLKSVGGKRQDFALGAYELKSGGYMAFGITNSFGHGASLPPGFADNDIYIMRLDNNGNLIKSITYGTKFSDIVTCVEQDERDNFYIAGYYYDSDTSMKYYPFIVKIDSVGNIVWSKYFYIRHLGFYSYISSIKVKNSILYVSSYHTLPSTPNYYYHKILSINATTGDILIWNNKQYPYLEYVHDKDSKSLSIINNKLYTHWWFNKSPIYQISAYAVFDTASLKLLYSTHITKPYRQVILGGYYIINEMNHWLPTTDGGFLFGSTAILDTINTTKNYLSITKTALNFDACTPDTGYVKEDTATIFLIPVATGSITSVNQGIVMSWTPTVVEGAKDSSLCFCPSLPVTIQTQSVSCFSNGSATVSPVVPGHYTFQWNPPVSTIGTASNLSVGNYTLTIIDSLGCSHKNNISINANFLLPLTIVGNTFICTPQSATLSATGASSYTWSTGSNNSVLIVQPTATSVYTLVAAAGTCTQSAVVTVSVAPSPTISFAPALTSIANGDTLHLILSGSTSYTVAPPDNYFLQDSNLFLFPRQSQYYCIIGTNNACRDSACFNLTVNGDCFNLNIPNVFTPNEDKINDEWKLNWKCPELVQDFQVQIFDRWGVLVFESNDKTFRWNGKPMTTANNLPKNNLFNDVCTTGTYFYIIEASINHKKNTYKGYITLLR